MLLTSFELSNFLSHRNTQVSLHPVTVFVGPCNSGKSAIFDGLLNLAQLASGRISQAFSPGPWSYASTLNRQAAPNGQIGFGATFSSGIQYQVAYREDRQSAYEASYEIISERLLTGGATLFDRSMNRFAPELSSLRGSVGADIGILLAIRTSDRRGLPQDVQAAATNVSRIVKFRLEPSNLKRVGEMDIDSRPRLRPRGERLASVLFYGEQNGSLSALSEVLREVLEGFEGFEFNTTREQDVGFSVRFRDGRGRVAAARLSDGTLHFLGLAALLVLGGDDLPAIVCLEEPEVGLNSAAMRKLVGLIYEVSSRGRSQMLISTHSPYLLTELWNRSTANPFESFNYVTLMPSGNEMGFSHVRPMSVLAREPALRREIDVRAAVKLLDGSFSETG
jgi:predicted ATPase